MRTISSYLHFQTSETSFKSTTSTRRGMWAGVAQSRLSSRVPFSLYVKDMIISSGSGCHVTQSIASRQVPEAYLSMLEHWLRDSRIDINISNSKPLLFTETTRCVQRHKPVQFFGERIQWVDTARYVVAVSNPCRQRTFYCITF